MNAIIAQTGGQILELGTVGVIALVLVMLLAAVAQVGLSYLGQRNLNDIHSMGIQAVVAQNQQSNLADELQETDENDGSQ